MMLVLSAALFAAFFLTLGESIQFDVTTIYYVNHTHNDNEKSDLDAAQSGIKRVVHARTNALGQRLGDGNTSFGFASTYMYKFACYQSSYCDWKSDNGDLLTVKHESIQDNKVYEVNDLIGISFKRRPENGVLMLFTPTDTLIRESSQYYRLKFTEGTLDWVKCNPKEDNGFAHIDRDGTEFSTACYRTEDLWFNYRTNLWISFKYSSIRMWDDEYQTNLVMNWKDDDDFGYVPPVDVRYFSNQPPGSMDSMGASLVIAGYLETNRTIYSPRFSPVSTDICLAVVFYSEDIKIKQLSVFVENQTQVQHQLSTFTETKAGLHYKFVNEILPSGFDSLIRIGIRNIGADGIVIRRLATCSPGGADIEVLEDLPGEQLERVSDLPVYDVVQDQIYNVERNAAEPAECQNGGKPIPGGCACPAGFVGPLCAKGCGRNRFGQDCEGVCSLHLQECQGLLLCTPTVGCHCAPGYKGTNCTTQCSKGEYGVSCQGTCGHCRNLAPCDIYTGECSLCAPGYHPPPYCNQVYMYCASKPEVSSPEYGKITVTFNPNNTKGFGVPKFYQVQYREEEESWINYVTNVVTSNTTSITETVEGLKSGVTYEVRVLLMNSNMHKYSGDLVPTSHVTTRCYIPTTFDYNIDARSEPTSISFYWTYVKESDLWCSVKSYEVSWKENWEELSMTTSDNFTLTDLLPGSEIQFKVRALTAGGYAPYSDDIVASTLYKVESPVRDLHVVSTQSKSAEVTWLPPRESKGEKLSYRIKYKCLEQLACSLSCHNSSDADLVQDTTSVTLSPLLPFSQYLVTVAVDGGSKSSIYVETAEMIPQEAPKLSTTRPQKTNTSLTVFWDPVPACSSYLLGYKYQLVKESETSKMLASGFTKYTNVTLDELEARTDYVVRVYVVTVAGWNPDVYLSISATTLAKERRRRSDLGRRTTRSTYMRNTRVQRTDEKIQQHNEDVRVNMAQLRESQETQDAVLDLTVYKRSRTMLGLRWGVQVTEGELQSFRILLDEGQEISMNTIEPSHCDVWPDLYCHTIDNLEPNHIYDVGVIAHSTEAAEDKEAVSVLGTTKESAPTVPENLKLINISSNSAILQWQHPFLANGIIRSYVISLEEISTFDQESCCQYYPLIEIPVRGEKQFYEAEVTDLRPASIYSLSVTAKTVMLGPSQLVEATTRPPHLSVALPQVEMNTLEPWTWQTLIDQDTSTKYNALIKARLLLVVVHDVEPVTTSESGINDPAVNSLLQHLIGKHFYFLGEYNQDEQLVLPGWKDEDTLWGKPQFSVWVPGQTYQLIAAQITRYGGVYNADLAFSTVFTLA